MYRAPGSDIEKFTDYMEQIMKSIKSNKILYVCGDFNIDLLKQDNHLKTKIIPRNDVQLRYVSSHN